MVVICQHPFLPLFGPLFTPFTIPKKLDVRSFDSAFCNAFLQGSGDDPFLALNTPLFHLFRPFLASFSHF